MFRFTGKVKILQILAAILLLSWLGKGEGIEIDTLGCKPYVSDIEENALPGIPFLFMGETWEKKYFITRKSLTGDFFNGAFNICEMFGFTLAKITTACEYAIVESWFKSNFPTDYSAWIAGFRFGDYRRPLWITTGGPLDLSQFGIPNADFIPGPYPPGGYSPIPYPWVNCLSVSRNCPLFTGAPTNPCQQSQNYPERLQFMWEDCRESFLRVICEEGGYSKKEIEDF